MRRPHFESMLRLAVAVVSLGFVCYVYLPSKIQTPYVWPNETVSDSAASQNQNHGQARLSTEAEQEVAEVVRTKWDVANLLNGPPTESLFDNLRNDTLYITSFLNAGWTNDVMSIVNTIYLAILTNRVAIVPPFFPMHVGKTTPFPFGDIFDISRLRERLSHPVIEWRDVKRGNQTDNIGCWTVWENRNGNPRRSPLDHVLHFDISYTKVPTNTEILNQHNSFWGLAKLGFPEGREEALRNAKPRPSNWRQIVQVPDDRLLCFDILYYTAAAEPFEWEKDYSPAWRFVGTHLRFNSNLVNLAEFYMRKAFGLAGEAVIPPFISIHVRHADFKRYCDGNPSTCYAPISVIAASVDEVRARLQNEKAIDISRHHVMMTSDETDPAWWAEVKQQGWTYVEHQVERTAEDLGKWYPTLIDAIIQCSGTGFVGTEGSTMSLVALRRVADWNGGLGVMVKFGANMYPNETTTSI